MPFPTPLTAYPPPSANGLLATLRERLAIDPFNGVATAIFACAIVHTFSVAWFARLAARVRAAHPGDSPSVLAELLLFFAEVEVVFGLWAIVLGLAIAWRAGWNTASHYLNDTINYTEPLFVVVIMTMASTRPVIVFAEQVMRSVARIGRGTPAAWWLAILTVGPLLGSLITEPAAMAISALLLARQFYCLEPSVRLRYATLGLLFVNVSIGGTLTHFAAPPVLMVARTWDWNTRFMLVHFGWRSLAAILLSNAAYWLMFRREMAALGAKAALPDVEQPDEDSEGHGRPLSPVPAWITGVHVAFLIWTVFNSHYPVIFVGGFLFFLGFLRATAAYQSRVDLRAPLLVGFFLAGLVIHGGLQGWWIAPVLATLSERPLFFGATALTTINDNALVTYLATLVPNFGDQLKLAVVEGAVIGGGLTVIANAPNPAGQAILARFFGGVIHPLGLAVAALLPTLLAILAYRLL
jgi:Putative Na+/H+ antiporter